MLFGYSHSSMSIQRFFWSLI